MSNNPANLNVAGLDERQVAVRNRSGFWAWLLLVILLFANGWINDSVGRWEVAWCRR